MAKLVPTNSLKSCKTPPMGLLPALALAMSLGLLLTAAPARAQSGDALGPRVNAQQMLSAEFTRSAIAVLQNDGNQSGLRDDQYIRAEILLSLATELTPDDAQLHQLQAELAGRMGDDAARRQATLAYINLEPNDDAAQLDMILGRLGSRPTLDQRLAVVQRILDSSAADRLSSPLKSRLASYAAAAARELGDDENFRKFLTTATRADPTNAQAAELMVQLARDRGADARLLGAVSINQVRAEPLTPQPRLRLARILLGQSAFADAARQYAVAARLTGGPLTPDAYRAWIHALAAAGRPQDAISLIDQLEKVLQQGAKDAAGQASQNNPAADPESQPDQPDQPQTDPSASPSGDAAMPGDDQPAAASDQPLPIDLQAKRVLILWSMGSDTRVNELYNQLKNRLTAQTQSGQAGQAGQTLATLQALLGRDLDQAQSMLESVKATDEVRAIRGLIALQQGQRDRAQELLKPLSEDQPLAAYGTAMLSSVDKIGQGTALARVAQDFPTSIPGMLAGLRAADAKQPVQATPVGRALLSTMQRYPSRLWDADLQSRPWLEIQMSAQPGRFGFLEPIPLKLTLTNTTQMPLSLGAGRTVPTRVFVSISPSVRGQVLGQLPPVVADAAQQLTLGPNQSITKTLRLDRSVFGLFIAARPFTSMRYNATAVLDPRASSNGGVEPGPLGGRETVRALQAWTLSPTPENIQAWLGALQSDDDLEQFQAIAWLLALDPNSQDAPIDPETANQIAGQVQQAYQGFGPVRRAWTIKRSIPADDGRAALEPVYKLARTSDQPMVRIAYLLAHATSPDAPALADAAKSDNTQIRRFALAMQAGFRAKADAGASGSNNGNANP